MFTVNKQGDNNHLHTNLCREALWRATEAMALVVHHKLRQWLFAVGTRLNVPTVWDTVMTSAQHGSAKTTKSYSEGVWKVTCYAFVAYFIIGADSFRLLPATAKVR